MRERSFFGLQMTKRIDRIDRSIERLIEFELGHVTDDSFAFDPKLLKFLLAILESGWIEVQTGHGKTSGRHIANKST